jgi:GPH family glycoside/pentoside/hexuronide:cation symporter
MATTISGTSPPSASADAPPGSLPTARLVRFAAILLPITAAQLPIGVYLPTLYAQHFGLSLTVLGAIFLAERIWGTVADPIVGLLSDRSHGRHGRRKPWIVAGAAVYAVATIFLFFPFLPVTPLYLAAALFAFYLAWSMIYIPYLAWSGEVSGEYHERTRVATVQTVVSAVALLLVLLLPTLIDQVRPDDAALKLYAMGGVILLTLPPTLLLSLRAFPEPRIPAAPARQRMPFGTASRLILREGPLVRVLLSDFAVSVGQGMRGGLIVFYVSYYVGLPKWASGLYLAQFLFGIVAGPIWAVVARRLGKHRTAVVAELLQAGINLALLLVQPGQIALLLILTVAQGLAQGSGNLMLRSMVADVADRHRLATGTDRAALFFSVFSISQKAGMAAAIGIALPLVAWFGFDPVKANAPAALQGLALVFALGPAIAHIASAALIHGFPIDQARHAEIRRALDARDALADAS